MEKILTNKLYFLLDNLVQDQVEVNEHQIDTYPFIYNKDDVFVAKSIKDQKKINILINIDVFLIIKEEGNCYSSLDFIKHFKIKHQGDTVYAYINRQTYQIFNLLKQNFNLFYFSQNLEFDQLKKVIQEILPRDFGRIVNEDFDKDQLGRNIENIFTEEMFIIITDVFFNPKIDRLKKRCFFYMKNCILNQKNIFFDNKIFEIDNHRQTYYFSQSSKQFLSQFKFENLCKFLSSINQKFVKKVQYKEKKFKDFINYYNFKTQKILQGQQFCILVQDKNFRNLLKTIAEKLGAIVDEYPFQYSYIIIERTEKQNFENLKKQFKILYDARFITDCFYDKRDINIDNYAMNQFNQYLLNLYK